MSSWFSLVQWSFRPQEAAGHWTNAATCLLRPVQRRSDGRVRTAGVSEQVQVFGPVALRQTPWAWLMHIHGHRGDLHRHVGGWKKARSRHLKKCQRGSVWRHVEEWWEAKTDRLNQGGRGRVTTSWHLGKWNCYRVVGNLGFQGWQLKVVWDFLRSLYKIIFRNLFRLL